jgi:hypothetical protein
MSGKLYNIAQYESICECLLVTDQQSLTNFLKIEVFISYKSVFPTNVKKLCIVPFG